MNKEIYIKCACSGEGLYINYDKEDNLYYLAIFSLGFRDPSKLSFLEKIRWIWYLIKNGKPYNDQFILNKKEVDKLIRFFKS